MVQRSCVLTSSQDSLSPCRVWLEARGEALHPPTALSWPLARWVAGESEEAVRCTLSAREPENSEEREIALSLTMSQRQNRMSDSPPALLQGKERRCPRHLLRSSSFPHLRVPCQGRVIASLDVSGQLEHGGTALLRAGLDEIQHGAEQLWRTQEGATATSRLGLALRRSVGRWCTRRGKMC